MSTVTGTISVNVEFRDTTTSTGVQSLKTVTLREATEYTTGKVAIVTGTVGTNAVGISVLPSGFKDATGNNVSFSQIARFAFSATGSPARCSSDYLTVQSSNGNIAVCEGNGSDESFLVSCNSGTAIYTLVLYGT